MTVLRQFNPLMAPYALSLLAAGFLAVGIYNWLLWQRGRAMVARLQHERTVMPTLARFPKISALVAAWNERDQIDAHIRSFLALRYPDMELILCAGGTDDTLERARHYAGDRVIVLEQLQGEGKQHALARCLERASGEIIYLTDADCRYSGEALYRLLAPLLDEGEQAATGSARPLDEQARSLLPSYLWASDVVASARNPVHIRGLLGRNAMITRAALERSGGLDFSARTGTDYHLAQRLVRAGIAIRHVSSSVVPTQYPETLRAYRKKRSRWLRNLVLYGRQYGARRDVQTTWMTIAIGALMLVIPLSAAVLGPSILVPWVLLITHSAASKLRYIFFTARLYRWSVPAPLLAALVPLTLVDFVIWALPALDLLHPRTREQW